VFDTCGSVVRARDADVVVPGLSLWGLSARDVGHLTPRAVIHPFGAVAAHLDAVVLRRWGEHRTGHVMKRSPSATSSMNASTGGDIHLELL
jgi:hypothetical protein